MEKKVQRDFILGDKWFYIKLYTGVKTADTVLLEVIKPLSEYLLANKLIKKWFFIRYSDPDFHLRVRFDLLNQEALGAVIMSLNNSLKLFLDNKLISSLQVDTYSRELERYGSKTIDEAETLFFYDSQATIDLLDLIEGDEGEIYRWHFACLAVDRLLTDFRLSENEKLKLMDSLQFGFGQEFGMNNQLKVQLDKKFRDERNQLRGFLLGENEFYNPFYDILQKKSELSKNVVNTILQLHKNKSLKPELNNLLGSYIHMLLNRIFKSKQRLNEMTVYSLLFRFYRSEIARKKKQVKT